MISWNENLIANFEYGKSKGFVQAEVRHESPLNGCKDAQPDWINPDSLVERWKSCDFVITPIGLRKSLLHTILGSYSPWHNRRLLSQANIHSPFLNMIPSFDLCREGMIANEK